jgi:hypothetical protein
MGSRKPSSLGALFLWIFADLGSRKPFTLGVLFLDICRSGEQKTIHIGSSFFGYFQIWGAENHPDWDLW